MWGTEASDFKNFCPFFWLLVGSIVLLPVYTIIKPLIFILGKLFGIKLVTIPRKEKEALIITVGKISSYIFQLAFTLFISFMISLMLVMVVQVFIEKNIFRISVRNYNQNNIVYTWNISYYWDYGVFHLV